jgi:hypothetical protein
MTAKRKSRSDKDKVDAQLDEALADTFPASDPPAMTEPSTAARATPRSRKRPPAVKTGGAPS